ncbi:DUF4376 domain-containing protein [Mesobaculum littorinae]|uniref:DUF4376 domain-containing protein n=1 Tax=Mesobaculum littorinae TaxID=2486419 RepID=A0A438ALY1_9RHOB|nr:DUF4376 domain-containing protein [Mesobaculum littorinae]RVV99692.1 DUF4376 domain-containing protein [Mesobaculum littorinae]
MTFTLTIETAEDKAAAEQARRRAGVNAERDRRLAAGFTFAGHVFQTDEESKQRIVGAATMAGFAMGQGAGAGDLHWHEGAAPFAWITADNAIAQLDAPSVFALGQAAAAHEQAHIFAARALKDAPGGIPEDFADDRHWPSGPMGSASPTDPEAPA